ncbi:hypothetical protein HAX54_046221 [Datura stramonium]|uniref:Uncharacterized protein n=1 Tax=Datura stramonium TaxID=4076 RepID=A0ABS8WKG0_DATST|nr:hypothetical protein [Datura stramonium]
MAFFGCDSDTITSVTNTSAPWQLKPSSKEKTYRGVGASAMLGQIREAEIRDSTRNGIRVWLAYRNQICSHSPGLACGRGIRWHVGLSLAGKISAGTTNMIALGPKFAKKKVREYITTNPIWLSFNVQ